MPKDWRPFGAGDCGLVLPDLESTEPARCGRLLAGDCDRDWSLLFRDLPFDLVLRRLVCVPRTRVTINLFD